MKRWLHIPPLFFALCTIPYSGSAQYAEKTKPDSSLFELNKQGVKRIGLGSAAVLQRTFFGPPDDLLFTQNSQNLLVNRIGMNPIDGLSVGLTIGGSNAVEKSERPVGFFADDRKQHQQLAFGEVFISTILENGLSFGATVNYQYQRSYLEWTNFSDEDDESAFGFQLHIAKLSPFAGSVLRSSAYWSVNFLNTAGEESTVSGPNILLNLHHFSTEKGRSRISTDRLVRLKQFRQGQGFINGGSGLRFSFLTQRFGNEGQLFGRSDDLRIVDWQLLVQSGLFVANGLAIIGGLDFRALSSRRLNENNAATIGRYAFNLGLQSQLAFAGIPALFISAIGTAGTEDELSVFGSPLQSSVLSVQFGLGCDYFISQRVSLVPMIAYDLIAADRDAERESSIGFQLSMRSYFK